MGVGPDVSHATLTELAGRAQGCFFDPGDGLVCVFAWVLRAAGGCASAENGGVSFSASFSRMLVFLRTNRSFQGFLAFSDGDGKVCECVCGCRGVG